MENHSQQCTRWNNLDVGSYVLLGFDGFMPYMNMKLIYTPNSIEKAVRQTQVIYSSFADMTIALE